ncbi:MAG: ribonuclease III [Pseudomonadales bacterium]|jgi:ribonuclease-3
MPMSLQSLETKIGYQFAEQDLLRRALTHRSYGAKNNERLEYLGDAILNFVIANALYQQFPTAHEGQLSRLRARLVRGQTLAELAREMSLGDYLTMGVGELRSGGFNRDSILSDALEAIMGAIYEDAGLEVARKNIMDWFAVRLADLSLANSQKDPKTRLQEFLQSKQVALPEYTVLEVVGKAPDQTFYVQCKSSLLKDKVIGEGSNRRIAEQSAAAQLLNLLGEENNGG